MVTRTDLLVFSACTGLFCTSHWIIGILVAFIGGVLSVRPEE